MKPLFSVILPTFNPSKYIFEAINSILNQENIDANLIEILVVDDHSNNLESISILKELESIEAVTLIKQSFNKGPSFARNIGIKIAKGKYICFIDDDDLWPLNKLKIQQDIFDKNQHLMLVSGQIQYFLEENTKDPIDKYHEEGKILYHVHLGACLLKSELFEKTKILFNENLRLSEDWDWWLKIKEKNIPHLVLDQPMLLYRVHQKNSSTHLSINELGLLKVLKSSLDRRREDNAMCEILPPHKGEKKMYEVTVVIPLYNGISYISRALDSVINQTYPVKEIIIVDDGSTDLGVNFIQEKYPNVNIIKQLNAGVAKARNCGWKAATTTWIAFLDQDDEWLPNKIELQIIKAKENKQIDWIGCYQRFQTVDGKLPSFIRSDFNSDHLSQVPSAWIVRKNTLITLNGFNEKYKYGSDLDILRRYRDLGLKEENCKETLLIKHFTGENETMDLKKNVKEMLAIIHEQIKQKK